MNDIFLLILTSITCLIFSSLIFTRRKRDLRLSEKYLMNKINDLSNLAHVLVIKKGSGLKIYEQSFCSDEFIGDVHSGLFEAISSVSSQIGTGEKLRRLAYENFQILMFDGKHVRAVCISKEVPTCDFLNDALTVFVKKFEGKYAGKLMEWRGLLNIFDTAIEILDEAFSTYLIYPISLMWDGTEDNLTKLELNILKSAKNMPDPLFTIPSLVTEVQKNTKKSEMKLTGVIKSLLDRQYFLSST